MVDKYVDNMLNLIAFGWIDFNFELFNKLSRLWWRPF